MIIAGGKLLINKINKSKNKLIPLRLRTFFIFNSNINNKEY